MCEDTEHIGRNLRSGISRIHSLLELWLVSPPATIRQDGITSALIVGFVRCICTNLLIGHEGVKPAMLCNIELITDATGQAVLGQLCCHARSWEIHSSNRSTPPTVHNDIPCNVSCSRLLARSSLRPRQTGWRWWQKPRRKLCPPCICDPMPQHGLPVNQPSLSFSLARFTFVIVVVSAD